MGKNGQGPGMGDRNPGQGQMKNQGPGNSGGNATRWPGHDRGPTTATQGPDAVDDGADASESAPGKPVTPKTNQTEPSSSCSLHNHPLR